MILAELDSLLNLVFSKTTKWNNGYIYGWSWLPWIRYGCGCVALQLKRLWANSRNSRHWSWTWLCSKLIYAIILIFWNIILGFIQAANKQNHRRRRYQDFWIIKVHAFNWNSIWIVKDLRIIEFLFYYLRPCFHCVTRAPLLHCIRSWVSISFKVCESVSQWVSEVSESGIGNTCPNLHFVQYIKA